MIQISAGHVNFYLLSLARGSVLIGEGCILERVAYFFFK